METMLCEFKTPWGRKIKAESRDETIDWNTLESCIVEDEYQIQRLPETGLAVDLGAYIGGATLALIARGWYVYAVEPLPENVEMLRKNLLLNGFEKSCTVIQKSIGRDKIFYGNTNTEFGRMHRFNGSGEGGESIMVEKTTLRKILNKKRCNFLKIDIEGSEWNVDFSDRIDRIAVEIEGNPASTQEFGKLLPNFNDVSKEYFPKWCEPSELVHGYFLNNPYLK